MLPYAKVETSRIEALLEYQIATANFFLVRRFNSTHGGDTFLAFCDRPTNDCGIDGEHEGNEKFLHHWKTFFLPLFQSRKEFNEK
jgi:hypothetical protein